MNTNFLHAGRAVVVTGASSGIGAACALYMDKLGFQVFAGVRREADRAALESRASERLRTVFLDVTDPDSLRSSVEIVTIAVGARGLAGLVNNAGIAVAGPLEFLPLNEIRKQFEVSVIGSIAVTQAFLPLLREGQGRIVNIGSLSGRIAMPFAGPYSAAKFALEALTDSLRAELRPWHISVSLIEPGFIATPIWEKAGVAADHMLQDVPPQAQSLYGTTLPTVRKLYANFGKIGTPANQVAKKVVHALTAAKPKTRYIVGRGALFGTTIFAHLPDPLRDMLIARLLMNRR